jgi:hypothetical protein
LPYGPPPQPDFRTAANDALAAFRCGQVVSNGTADLVSLRGFAPASEIQAAQRALAAAEVPPAATRMQVEAIGDRYCGTLAAARPYMAPDAAWQASLDGPSRLTAGQVLRVRVQLPDWPAHVYLGFLMTTGEVAHLMSTPAADRSDLGAERDLGDRGDARGPLGTAAVQPPAAGPHRAPRGLRRRARAGPARRAGGGPGLGTGLRRPDRPALGP